MGLIPIFLPGDGCGFAQLNKREGLPEIDLVNVGNLA